MLLMSKGFTPKVLICYEFISSIHHIALIIDRTQSCFETDNLNKEKRK